MEDYVKYFEHQAENHPALAHNAATGDRVFAVISVDEALGDFRSGTAPKGYILRLIEYSFGISDKKMHETYKIYEGGFIVGHYYSARAGGSSAYLEAMAKAERVAEDIIEKMIADSKNGHPLFYYSLDSNQDFTVSPHGYAGDSTYAAWICTFKFKRFWPNCITRPDAPAWLDDGETPFVL